MHTHNIAAIPVEEQWDMQPVSEWIQVEIIQEEIKRKSGLVIAEDEDRQVYGKVIAVGDGIPLRDGGRDACKAKPGDRVVWQGPVHSFYVNGETVHVVRQQQLLCILRRRSLVVPS